MLFNKHDQHMSNEESFSLSDQQREMYNDSITGTQVQSQIYYNDQPPRSSTTQLIAIRSSINQLEPSSNGISQQFQHTNNELQKLDTVIENPVYINEIELGIASNKVLSPIFTLLIAQFPGFIDLNSFLTFLRQRESKSIKIVGTLLFLSDLQFSGLPTFIKYRWKLKKNNFCNLILKYSNVREQDKEKIVCCLIEYLNIKCVFDHTFKYKQKSDKLLEKIQQKVIYKYLDYQLIRKGHTVSFRHYQYILSTLLQQLKDYHARGYDRYLDLEIKLLGFQELE